MFINKNQIIKSLKNLELVHPFFGTTFLVFEASKLPIGKTVEFNISDEEQKFLDKYYKPDESTSWYYRVFRVSNRNQYWLRPDYPSSGSQSTRTRKFRDAFIHKKGTKTWGWQKDYIQILKSQLYRRQPIPAFDLAIWLYRNKKWKPGTTAQDIVDLFFLEFKMNEVEKNELFDTSVSDISVPNLLFQPKRVLWEDIRNIINPPPPPDAHDEGGILSSLELQGVGPARKLKIELAERINLITGDNGLGKTFILESAWWALSGSWAGTPVYPRDDAKKNEPQITFQISSSSGRPEIGSAKYDWKKQYWLSIKKRHTTPGLLIYARVDGAFAVWDPSRSASSAPNLEISNLLVFTREDVWDGLRSKAGGKTRYLCNGLVNDWVNWQSNPDTPPFQTLKKVLKRLSPPSLAYGDLGILEPDEPARIPGESRLIPTIKHSYGKVPLIYASASVRRIVALAYLIIWVWEEHKAQSELIREQPQRKMVVLVDEIEAHLHPQWQRVILPALLDVIDELETDLQVQFLVATHSPLVMASIEPRFDQTRDKIFHLNLTQGKLFDGEVMIEEPEFVFYGSANSWLMSDIFEMKQPRSIEAECAIEDAKALQMRDTAVTKEEVQEVSERLQEYLPDGDKFWPRWTFFAERYGVEL